MIPKKNSFKMIMGFFLLVFLVVFWYTTTKSQSGKEAAYSGDFKPFFANNRVVIKFYSQLDKSNIRFENGLVVTGIKSIDELNARYNVDKMTQLFPGSEKILQAAESGLPRIYRIEFPEVLNVSDVVKSYANDPSVEYAQPVGIHKVYAIPSDPSFSNQWGMTKIQAPNAWDITHGDTSIILAILDTGVDWLHPDLGGTTPYIHGNIWTNWSEYNGTAGVDDDGNGFIDDIRGWDWVNVVSSSYPTWPGEDGTIPDNDPRDFNGHGTHCAGIASAMTDNGVGVAGLGWNCKIMPLRAGWSANYAGYEVGLVDMSFCAQGIYYAASNGASAVNCSWGSSNTGGIADAINFASSMGTVVVSAAGNDDLPDASYLCSREDVISVAATDPYDGKTSYSSYGFWVDIAAPGGDYPPTTDEIYSTYYDHVSGSHTYEWLSGTSMAAPHVVGLIGLVNDQFPGLNWRGVKSRIQFTSDNIDLLNPNYKNGMLGEGRINALKAVSQIDLPLMTELFAENFDSGLPPTWTADVYWRDNDPGNRDADFDNTYEAGTIRVNYDIWTPPFMIVDSDYEGSIPIDASLVSPIIDCSLGSNLRLVFNNWFQNYGGGNIERGDIDIRISNGPWQTVASFIDNGSYNVVDAGKEVVVRLPSIADYQSNVQIRWHYYNANYDWYWGIDNVKIVGEMITQDYYVQISPSWQTAKGDTGDTVLYRMKVKNLGLQSDSYDLTANNFSWSTTIWDSTGTNQISNTGVLTSRQELSIMVKVEVPLGVDVGDADTALIVATSNTDASIFDDATLVTVMGSVGRIPWFEDFPTTTIDTLKWSYNYGPAEINSTGLNPPSPPYSLNLDGNALGGDEIQSCAINLAGENGVILSYYFQRTGGGNSTEAGEDLWVDYLNSSNTWVNLQQHPGDGPDMTNFEPVSVGLPADAYHSNFKIRFRNLATSGDYDDWFVDDILLTWGPDMFVYPDPDPLQFNVELGDSANGKITIKNTGQADLNFQIGHTYTSNDFNSNFLQTNFFDPRDTKNIEKNPNFDKNARTTEGLYLGNQNRNPSGILAMGDVLRSWVAPSPMVDPWGVGFDNANVWLSDYYSDQDYQISTEGVLLSSFSCAPWIGTWPADLAWDGQYLWQVNVGGDNGIYQLNPSNGAVINSIHDPNHVWDSISQRGLAYDRVEDVFYVGGWNQDMVYRIKGLSWSNPGEILSSFSFINVSGLGWHPSGTLWIAINDYVDMIYQVDPQNGTVLNQFAAPGAGDGYWGAGLEVDNEGNLWVICQDNNFVYQLDSGTPVITWLAERPRRGTISPGDSAIVTVSVYANEEAGILPGNTYNANITVNGNPGSLSHTEPVSMTVTRPPFYFSLKPTSLKIKGKAGDTLDYVLTIENLGQQSDSYTLIAAGNSWPTTFWDSTGTTQITSIGPLPSTASVNFITRVEIPSNTVYGDADTAQVTVTSVGRSDLSKLATIESFSVGTPFTIPWFEDFPTTTLNPTYWIYNTGPAEVNNRANNEPSPPNSLNLNGYSTGGDEVRSTLFDLSGDTLVILEYQWQRGGTGNPPEYGDNLWVDYLNASGSWVNLREHEGNGYSDQNFTLEEIVLPADAYHNAFQIRLRSVGSSSPSVPDDWFVDDIRITRPPVIHVEPERYNVEVRVGESEIGEPPLTITNLGEGILRYKVSSFPIFTGDAGNQIVSREPATRDYPANYFTTELGKDAKDPRRGAPVIYNSGGPDLFGHIWVDSDQPGGPNFDWIDIRTNGTQITGLGDDINVGPFPIGFTFDFYGNSFTTFRICSNGFISFTSNSASLSNEPIPNQSVFDLIAVFWDDLIYDTNSRAYYHFDGDKLIIACYDVRKYGTSEYNTFEILLYTNGTIKFQYLTMQSSSNAATIGIQNNNGTDGLEIAFNTDYVHDGLAILISTGVSWIEFDRTSGVLNYGETDTIQVTFTAEDILVDSVLNANINILSNDPDSIDIVPAEMRVRKADIFAGTIFSVAGNPLGQAVAQAWDEYPNGNVIDQDTTNANGEFLLAVPPIGGVYTIRAYCKDYIPSFKEKVPVNTLDLHFILEPAPSVTPTTEWVDFFSDNSQFWKGPVQIGDVITAEDPDRVVCGIFTVREPGDYGFMPVYKDDDTTPAIDEGAQPGDTITFKINGQLAETLGPDSPVWTSHGSIRNVDLYVGRRIPVTIPLTVGWNLVSWYVDTDQDSTHQILKDILNNVIIVMSYENGGLTYRPDLPGFSNLMIMDHLHGYWIKMKQEDDLIVFGDVVEYLQTPLYCETGWNLVSYLPEEPDSVAHALETVLDNVVRAYGFKNGAMTYDPRIPGFSTLNILCPTFGYWIYLTQNDTLNYPDPIPGLICPYDDPLLAKTITSTGQNWSNLIPTNEWINIYGEGITLDGKLLPVGTRISAKAPNDLTCGEFIVSTPGSFGFMPVYRDDPFTDITEGAKPGDQISIFFNELELPVKVTWGNFGDVIDLGAIITSVVGELRNIPKAYDLAHNFPNPFNPETSIKFQLPKDGYVSLDIYNMLGQRVRTLVAEEKKAGYYQVVWDGRDQHGIVVANGIYLYRLKAGNYEKTRKMVMLK